MVKPAEDTPLSALALGLLAEQAGFPKGNIYDKVTIHGFSSEISFYKITICNNGQELQQKNDVLTF